MSVLYPPNSWLPQNRLCIVLVGTEGEDEPPSLHCPNITQHQNGLVLVLVEVQGGPALPSDLPPPCQGLGPPEGTLSGSFSPSCRA